MTDHHPTGLRADVRNLCDDYAAALDDGDLDAWTRFFTDDGVYRVVSLENHREQLPLSTIWCQGAGALRDRVAAIRQTAVFEPRTLRHVVGTVRINAVDGEEIVAQCNFATFESLSDREPHVFLVGRYLDRIVRSGEQLRFKERVCVFDNHRIRTSLVYPV